MPISVRCCMSARVRSSGASTVSVAVQLQLQLGHDARHAERDAARAAFGQVAAYARGQHLRFGRLRDDDFEAGIEMHATRRALRLALAPLPFRIGGQDFENGFERGIVPMHRQLHHIHIARLSSQDAARKTAASSDRQVYAWKTNMSIRQYLISASNLGYINNRRNRIGPPATHNYSATPRACKAARTPAP